MRIKKISMRHRRDLDVVLECEHCGTFVGESAYDDAYFHNEVLPVMVCKSCGESSPDSYVPMKPLYPEGMQL